MTEAKTKGKNIFQKIAAIQAEIPTLQKNGVGPQAQGSYKYLSVDDIFVAVKPLEEKHGVIVVMEEPQVGFHYNTAADKGDGRVPKEATQAFGTFGFRAINTEADDPFADSYYFTVPAEGADSSDKAIRKTVTQAQKIAYITLYRIITGEVDPDAQDGAADVQSEPSAVDRKVEAARKPATGAAKPAAAKRTQPAARSTSDNEFKAKVRTEWVETGKVTGQRATELAKEAAAKGFESDEEKWKYVLKILETGGE